MKYSISYHVEGDELKAEASGDSPSAALREFQRKYPEIGPEAIYSIKAMTEDASTPLGDSHSAWESDASKGINAEGKARDPFDRLTDYGTTRNLLSIFMIIGWVVVGLGVFWGLYLIVNGAIVGLISGGGIVLLGFFIIFTAQITLAVINTADNSRKILDLIRKINESKD